jgi:hypothetical protein
MWSARMSSGTKITPQPEYDALNAFDAENNAEPARTIAERIGLKYAAGRTHPLVDDISHAIEDAIEWGQRRAAHLPAGMPQSAELRYATRLAVYLYERHWADASSNWKPLPDLMGVLTQIDNMIANFRPAKVEGK